MRPRRTIKKPLPHVPVYLTTFQVFCAVFFLFEEDFAEEFLEDVLFPAPERVEDKQEQKKERMNHS